MTKRKPKAPEVLKVPCMGINRIIVIKKFSDAGIKKVYKVLRSFIENCKGIVSITEYINILLDLVLTDDEKANLLKTKATAQPKDFDKICVELYRTIIDNYTPFRVDYVCSEFNGWIPESISQLLMQNMAIIDPQMPLAPDDKMNEKEFQKVIKKETAKPKPKVGDASFNSLEKIQALSTYLKSKIIGQDEAIETICNAIKLKSVGFTQIMTLFFIGPTGVGKSEVSKLLGDCYSGNFYQINCSDYSNGHEMNKLIGSPPGYIGHSDKCILFEKAEKSNKWVFLLDEIEKAHDKFFNWLLPLIETGTTYDNSGRLLDFSESIFIFTSNCGVKDLKDSSINFGGKAHTTISSKEELIKSVKKEFSPEFRNRVDEFVFFNPISEENAEKIASIHLSKFPIKKTPEILKYVCDNGFSVEYGARELIRFIKKNVAVPLADVILSGRLPVDDTYLYDCIVDDGKVKVVNISA